MESAAGAELLLCFAGPGRQRAPGTKTERDGNEKCYPCRAAKGEMVSKLYLAGF